MKTRFFAALLIVSTLFAAPAFARETVPIINHENLVIATTSGKTLRADQVKQAIQAAAAAKGWTIAQQSDGKLLATLVVRDKHTIVVEITYAAGTYSLHYKDSKNMNFERDGPRMIHPYYNKWVQTLKESINIELLKL